MTQRTVTTGDVLMVRLPQHSPHGHEQEGTRPVIVVGMPRLVGAPRFEVLLGVPTSSRVSEWVPQPPHPLYPILAQGVGGLVTDSVVLPDHLRTFDVSRVIRHMGTLTPAEYAPIRKLHKDIMLL